MAAHSSTVTMRRVYFEMSDRGQIGQIGLDRHHANGGSYWQSHIQDRGAGMCGDPWITYEVINGSPADLI